MTQGCTCCLRRREKKTLIADLALEIWPSGSQDCDADCMSRPDRWIGRPITAGSAPASGLASSHFQVVRRSDMGEEQEWPAEVPGKRFGSVVPARKIRVVNMASREWLDDLVLVAFLPRRLGDQRRGRHWCREIGMYAGKLVHIYHGRLCPFRYRLDRPVPTCCF